MADCQGETPQQWEKKAKYFVKDTKDKLVFGRCHRVGLFKDNQSRKTIIKFDHYKQREKVVEEGKNLVQDEPMDLGI